MRATLDFDLPEERIEHLTAGKGGELAGLVHQLDQWLRQRIKHGKLSRGERKARELFE